MSLKRKLERKKIQQKIQELKQEYGAKLINDILQKRKS